MSFWKTLKDSAREAAGEYRKLAAQHRQELSAARDTLQAENARNLADLHGAFQRAAQYADTAEMHAALEETLRGHLLQNLQTTQSPRAEAVLARIQAAHPALPPLRTLVLVSDEALAFVGFGETIYLSTGILDRLPDDGALAFVIGHEATHIQAGHNQLAATIAEGLPVLPAMVPVQIGLGLLTRTWMSPQRELEADQGGLRLAVGAGYAPDCFDAVFDALAAVAIEKQMDALVERDLSRWGEFWQQKLTGYPTLRDRQARLQQLQSG